MSTLITSSDAEALGDPSLYINRELSWLDFNERVLELAEDDRLPLLERLKFLAIFTSNLDEFFMVRVAGVHEQVVQRVDHQTADGTSPAELMELIAQKARALELRHADQFMNVALPELAANGIRVVPPEESGASDEELEEHFRQHIFPALTPLAIGPGRPFPYISNLSLSLIVHLHDPAVGNNLYARV